MPEGASHRNEAALVRAIARALSHAHPSSWIVKTVGNPYQSSGLPDLLCCIEGRMLALEVKHRKPRESAAHARARATPRQRRVLQMIEQAGGVSGVVLSVDEALSLASRCAVPTTLSVTLGTTQPSERDGSP